MISTLTAFRHFDRAPALSYWTLATIASAITAVIIVRVARNLYEWLRMWWYLRGVPRPRPKQSSTLLIDMYKQLSAMDPSLDLKVRSFKYLQSLFKSVEDQDVTVAFFGPYPFLLGSTPQVVEAILGNTENVDRSFFYNMMKPWVGGGMLTLSGEAWRNRRKAIKPGYHLRILDGYIPTMNKTGERMMKQVASMGGEFFDVLPIARAATLDVLFETTMGIDYDEHRIERVGYLKIHDAISDSIANRATYFHYWFDSIYALSKDYKEMKRNVQKAKDFIDAIVHKRLADYRKGIKNPISSNVFLEILVRMCVDEGTMTEVDIRDECMANLIGGFDTSATNIASTLYLLGLHSEIQAKVHDEIDLVCGDDWEKPVTAEELKNLAYTECVLKESLRLYPPVPIIGRAVTKEIQIGNYTIPRGTVAVVASYFLQRHPRFFEDPNAFIPERFLDTKKINTYAFAAFSGGPRNCLGQTFAIREAKIFLTHILRRFEVTSKVPMDELVMTTDLILKPTQGLEIRLTPRSTHSAG